MSLIIPKKEILYAPMLGTLGGGSARGFGRGQLIIRELAIGGLISTVGSWTVHTFLSSGTLEVLEEISNVEYL